MELSPPREATSHAATQEIPQILWNPVGSLPCSQEASIGPYSEPDQSTPYHSILSKIYFNNIHPPTFWST
jgi:hypothetical protein